MFRIVLLIKYQLLFLYLISLSGGVMVAQEILVLSVKVRVLAGQLTSIPVLCESGLVFYRKVIIEK